MRSLLQLLLAISLILNGTLAPWAMAGMLAGHHGMRHAAPAQDAHAHHMHHGEHATMAVEKQIDKKSCCDQTVCQCGCVLPPALSLAAIEFSPPPIATQRFGRFRTLIAPHHQSPPLRPPTV